MIKVSNYVAQRRSLYAMKRMVRIVHGAAELRELGETAWRRSTIVQTFADAWTLLIRHHTTYSKHRPDAQGFNNRLVSSTATRAARFKNPFSSPSRNLSHLPNPSIEGKLSVSYPCLIILLIWRVLGLLPKRPFDLSPVTNS